MLSAPQGTIIRSVRLGTVGSEPTVFNVHFDQKLPFSGPSGSQRPPPAARARDPRRARRPRSWARARGKSGADRVHHNSVSWCMAWKKTSKLLSQRFVVCAQSRFRAQQNARPLQANGLHEIPCRGQQAPRFGSRAPPGSKTRFPAHKYNPEPSNAHVLRGRRTRQEVPEFVRGDAATWGQSNRGHTDSGARPGSRCQSAAALPRHHRSGKGVASPPTLRRARSPCRTSIALLTHTPCVSRRGFYPQAATTVHVDRGEHLYELII